jgi:hypothetical protein
LDQKVRGQVRRLRTLGGTDPIDNVVLLHTNCHRQVDGEGLVVEKTASREGRW